LGFFEKQTGEILEVPCINPPVLINVNNSTAFSISENSPH